MKKASKRVKNAKKRLRSAGKKISRSVKKAKKKAKKKKDEFLGAVGSVWSKAKKSASKFGSRVTSAIKSGARSAWGTLKAVASKPGGKLKLFGEGLNAMALAEMGINIGSSIYKNIKANASFDTIVDDAAIEQLFGTTSITVGLYATLGATTLISLALGPGAIASSIGIVAGFAASNAFDHYINNETIKRKFSGIGT